MGSADDGQPTYAGVAGVHARLAVDSAGSRDLGLGFDTLGPVFAGEPDTSVWQSASGDWTEW